MKYIDTHFMQLDKKWVAIKSKKNIEEIEKATEKKLDGLFYLGYSYLDHFTGRSIALIGPVKEVEKTYEPTYKPEKLKENIAKIDDVYIKESMLEVEVLEDKKINKMLKKAVEEYIEDSFYKPLHKSINSMRKDKSIDMHRAFHNPDNINILIDNEKLWCTIVEKDRKRLKGVLINTPNENTSIKRDDLLILEYNKEKNKYVCVDSYKPLEKKEDIITYKIKNKVKSYIFEGE